VFLATSTNTLQNKRIRKGCDVAVINKQRVHQREDGMNGHCHIKQESCLSAHNDLATIPQQN